MFDLKLFCNTIIIKHTKKNNMKLSLIAVIVSLMTIPTFAKYEVIYPVKDVNFITKTQNPVEPPIVPPVDPPEPECQFVYGGTTEWILYAKKINDNPNYGNRILWKGQIIFDTMHGNITKPRITSATVNGYVYTMGEYKSGYSSGSSGIWYHYHSVCRKPV